MEWLLLPAAAALAWYLGKRNGPPSRETPPETPPAEEPEDPPAITLKVKVFVGIYENPLSRVMGQAVLKVDESRRAFRSYWQIALFPPVAAIAQMDLTRTATDEVTGVFKINGVQAWKGPLLEAGQLIKYVKKVEILGLSLPAVTIQAFQ